MFPDLDGPEMNEVPEKLKHFECPKCNNTICKQGQLRGAGGFLTKLLDIQNRKFITYTCTRCGYTEMFESQSSIIGNVLDFFAGG